MAKINREQFPEHWKEDSYNTRQWELGNRIWFIKSKNIHINNII